MLLFVVMPIQIDFDWTQSKRKTQRQCLQMQVEWSLGKTVVDLMLRVLAASRTGGIVEKLGFRCGAAARKITAAQKSEEVNAAHDLIVLSVTVRFPASE